MIISELVKAAEVETKLQYHDELNPAIWSDNALRPEINNALLEIAEQFREYMNIEPDRVVDIIFTGSNANYNWSDLSDIDLHLIVDFSGEDAAFLDDYLKVKKDLWNTEHNIRLRGYDVELYTQKVGDPLVATGIYSVLQNRWETRPMMVKPSYDDGAVRAKAADIMNDIDSLIADDRGLEAAMQIKDRIKKMRQAGLEEAGEFSVENLAFKTLRNNNYLDKLSEYINRTQDALLSIA